MSQNNHSGIYLKRLFVDVLSSCRSFFALFLSFLTLKREEGGEEKKRFKLNKDYRS